MKIDAGLMTADLASVPENAKRLEAQGYDGIVTAETSHDPFFPLLLAAEHTQRVELMTSIAVAFARSPMNLANIGHDLNAYSKGDAMRAAVTDKTAADRVDELERIDRRFRPDAYLVMQAGPYYPALRAARFDSARTLVDDAPSTDPVRTLRIQYP